MKKWYVFDEYDTFFSFATAAQAAIEAEHLLKAGLGGMHIVHMSEAQFEAYCADSDLKKALAIRD